MRLMGFDDRNDRHARFAAWRARIARASPLARDITIILLVKAGVLALLWWAFFSTPVARHMNLDPKAVERQLLTVPPAGDAGRAVR